MIGIGFGVVPCVGVYLRGNAFGALDGHSSLRYAIIVSGIGSWVSLMLSSFSPFVLSMLIVDLYLSGLRDAAFEPPFAVGGLDYSLGGHTDPPKRAGVDIFCPIEVP